MGCCQKREKNLQKADKKIREKTGLSKEKEENVFFFFKQDFQKMQARLLVFLHYYFKIDLQEMESHTLKDTGCNAVKLKETGYRYVHTVHDTE